MATNGGGISVTISLGVVISSAWGNPGGEELIRQADAALYHVKNEGRNRVVLATPGGMRVLERSEGSPRAAFLKGRN